MTIRVTWAAATHPGARRAINEDCYCARHDLGLFVVADGMGGHAAGEVASRVAVDAIEDFVLQSQGDTQCTWPVPYDTQLSATSNRLRAAFILANRQIATAMAARDALAGMATTAVAVLIVDHDVMIAHVGDSRVYQLHEGTLTRLTHDHSWVEEQVRAGVLSDSAAREHPWRNVVTRALSGGVEPQVELTPVVVADGDLLLLCSDGLSSVLPDDRIAAVLRASTSLQATCDTLVELTNAAGGPDNITVLALQFHAV